MRLQVFDDDGNFDMNNKQKKSFFTLKIFQHLIKKMEDAIAVVKCCFCRLKTQTNDYFLRCKVYVDVRAGWRTCHG